MINLRQADGSTALFAATQANFPGIVEALARRGADVKLTLFDGTPPLCHAACKGNIEVLKRLLQAPGVQVDQLSQSQATALFYAAEQGHKQVVELLLENGADPDMADKNQVGPLHIACLHGQTEIVELLLNAGAYMESRTEQKYTCFEIARIRGHQVIMRLIEGRMRDRHVEQPRIEELSPCLRPAEPAPLLTTAGAGSAKAGGQALQDRPGQTGLITPGRDRALLRSLCRCLTAGLAVSRDRSARNRAKPQARPPRTRRRTARPGQRNLNHPLNGQKRSSSERSWTSSEMTGSTRWTASGCWNR